jgi:fumarate reductase subunit D
MTTERKPGFAFGKDNYIILIAGVALVIIGMLLMMGGGATDPKDFSEEIFSFRRITLAPIVILLGFAVVLYSIMRKPKPKAE